MNPIAPWTCIDQHDQPSQWAFGPGRVHTHSQHSRPTRSCQPVGGAWPVHLHKRSSRDDQRLVSRKSASRRCARSCASAPRSVALKGWGSNNLKGPKYGAFRKWGVPQNGWFIMRIVLNTNITHKILLRWMIDNVFRGTTPILGNLQMENEVCLWKASHADVTQSSFTWSLLGPHCGGCSNPL